MEGLVIYKFFKLLCIEKFKQQLLLKIINLVVKHWLIQYKYNSQLPNIRFSRLGNVIFRYRIYINKQTKYT